MKYQTFLNWTGQMTMKTKTGKVLIRVNDYHTKLMDIPLQAEFDLCFGSRVKQEAKNRMYEILVMRSEGKTQHEVGLAFGISRERARQLEVDAIRAVRKVYFPLKPSLTTAKT